MKSKEVVSLFNFEKNQAEAIEESQVQNAIQSGKYGFKKGVKINVKDSNGVYGELDSSEAYKAFTEGGFTYEPILEKIKRHSLKRADTQNIQAAVEGAARGATLGISDKILTDVFKVNPEEISARKEANYFISIASEVAGVVIPSLVTGGGAAATGIKALGTPARLASKASTVIESKLTKNLLKSTLGEPANKAVVSKIRQSILPKIAGNVVEGSLFATGELISETALGNADFNAESLISTIGAGAVLGGAVGGAFGGLQALAPLGKKVGNKIGSAGKGLVKGYTDPSIATLELLGKTRNQAAVLNNKNPRLVQAATEFMQDNLHKIEGGDAGLLNFFRNTKKNAGNSINDILNTMDSVITKDGKGISREVVYRDVVDSISTLIKSYDGAPGFGSHVKKLKKLRGDYVKQLAKPGPVKVTELQQIRQRADELINFNKAVRDRPLSQKALSGARTILRKKIDDVADNVSQSYPGYESLSKELKKHNRDFHVTSNFEYDLGVKVDKDQIIAYKDIISSSIGYAAGGTVGIGAVLGKKLLDSDIRRRFVILNSIEKGQKTFLKNLDKSISSFAGKGSKIPIKKITTKALTTSAISIDPDTGKKPKNSKEGFQNATKLINKLQSDPEFATKRLQGAVMRVSQGAPEAALASQITLSRALQFLSQNLPRRASKPSAIALLSKKTYQPSSIDLAKFEQYLAVIDNPNIVLHQIQEGTINRESIKALKAVYPVMFSKIQEAAMQKIAENPDEIPYSKKLQMGILLDIPADVSLIPENVLALQETFSQDQPEDQSGAVKPTQGGLKNIDISDRMKTETQKLTT